MSDRTHEFDVTGSPRIDVRLRSSDVVIRPSNGQVVAVILRGNTGLVDSVVVDATHDSVSVRSKTEGQKWSSKTLDVLILAPEGSNLRVSLASGEVVVRVPLRTIDVNSASADVRIDEAVEDVRIKVASGNVAIRQGIEEASIISASGDIRLEAVGDSDIASASGAIEIGALTGSGKMKSASGNIRVHEFSGPEITVGTLSGDSTIGIPPGRTIEADIKSLSGQFRNRLEPSDIASTGRMRLKIKSFSGNVTLRSPW